MHREQNAPSWPRTTVLGLPISFLCNLVGTVAGTVAGTAAPCAAAEEDPLTKALRELAAEPSAGSTEVPRQAAPGRSSVQVGAATLRLIDLSLDGLFAAGTSTEDDESLQSLQGGGHDPRKRGFTVQNVELSFVGAVDPYLTGEVHIIYFIEPLDGGSVMELEEAFVTTQALPFGFQLEAGHFFTEFGRINAQHPHAWDWQDQPVINTRLFGPDGMRGPGARLGWLSPLPWFSVVHAGLQNASGETMASFFSSGELAEERPFGARPFVDGEVHDLGDLAYLLRWENGFDLTPEVSTKAGLSFLYGPNFTGDEGDTHIYGADVVVKWRPLSNDHGWPFVIWQSEIMRRDLRAAEALDPGADPVDPADDTFFAADTFHDWGLYTQLLWGFERGWATGLRYEFAASEELSASEMETEPFRNDRHRISPLLVWHPTEFSRLRFQYNYDHARHLHADEAHSFWVGIEVLIGSHPAHAY